MTYFVRRLHIALLAKEGWTRHQEDAAKRPLKGADGVVAHEPRDSQATTPSAPLRWLRPIFLRAQPPLLCKEGNTPHSQIRDRNYESQY